MALRPSDIVIQEPPIQELTRQYSCLRKSCLSCLSFLLVLVGISLVLLKFALGNQTQNLAKVPVTITREVPVYDPDSIEKITETSGSQRNRGIRAAAFLPKLLAGPILATFDKNNSAIKKAYAEEGVPDLNNLTWRQKVSLILNAPIGDNRDEITIKWHEVVADQKFLVEYYRTELTKRGFTITSESRTDRVAQFTFTKNNIAGNIFIENDPATPATDSMRMTIHFENGKPANSI